jgi:dihydrolipoamide dehydrogenase
MSDFQYDLMIIGAGPGGYVAAIRAAQLGLKTAVIERDKPGGVCLNIGCIPSKSLIHQATVFAEKSLLQDMGVKIDVSGLDFSKVFHKSRLAAEKLSQGVQFLLRKNRVEYIKGYARVEGPHKIKVDDKGSFTTKNILIATGSRPRDLGGDFTINEQDIISSNGALMATTLPKSVVILGSGAIGLEFAYVWNCFGVGVTVVEMLDRILPLEDREHSELLKKILTSRGMTIMTGQKAVALKRDTKGLVITLEDAAKKQQQIEGEKLLVAVGRTPNTENIGLESIGISLERGFVPVGDYYQTKVPGVYAIGDIIASPLLAHVASKEGEIAVTHMAGAPSHEKRIDPMEIPSVTYCIPEVASFGLTEDDAKKQGLAVNISRFPFSAIGRAVASETTEGQVKLVSIKQTGEIVGAHILGPGASDLIHELLLARHAELTTEEIGSMIHAHPTLAEAVVESAYSSLGHTLHI